MFVTHLALQQSYTIHEKLKYYRESLVEKSITDLNTNFLKTPLNLPRCKVEI